MVADDHDPIRVGADGKGRRAHGWGFSVPAFVYIVFGVVLLVIWLVATRRPVNEPYRAVIYRLATMHRISGPGYVFVLPFIDRIESELDMGERECAVAPRGGRTADDATGASSRGHMATASDAAWASDACGPRDIGAA
jgi:hypothetical protein